MIEKADDYAVEPIEAEVEVAEDGAMSVRAPNFPFKEVRNLGKGAYGSVWKVEDKDGKAYCAKY